MLTSPEDQEYTRFAADVLRSSRNEKNDGVTTKITALSRSYQIIFVTYIEKMHSEERKSVNIGAKQKCKNRFRNFYTGTLDKPGFPYRHLS